MLVQARPFRHADNDKASGVTLIRWIIDICPQRTYIHTYIHIYICVHIQVHFTDPVYIYKQVRVFVRNMVEHYKIFNMLHGRVTITVTANYIYSYRS